MEEQNITAVTTGTIRSDGNRLNEECFAMDMVVKRASEVAQHYSKQFHASRLNINHPDINHMLIQKWAFICRHKNDTKIVETGFRDMEAFGKSVLEAINNLREKTVDGIPLFRR